MILSLAYVPLEDIKFEIQKLDNFFNNNSISEMSLIWKDFKSVYCRDVEIYDEKPRNIFAVTFWSVYNRIINNVPITTNCLEGWHRSLNNNFIKAHPSLLEFGIELKKNTHQ
ncbi:hypothetical protein DMUE_3358 [Dictyocoela muelleri]|nr:hypothetical protein DMUE_3358 [Dictyocoela muelleri]